VRACALCLLVVCSALGCGSPPPAAYVRETEQAQAARVQGQHAQAAQHYERAAALADKPRDAEEARYRAADSYARAGDTARAQALYESLAALGPDAEWRARADFAIADLLRKTGHEAEGPARVAAALRRQPNSGLARLALSQHLDYLRAQGGSEQVLAYLSAESQALANTELSESIAYRRARELDEQGKAAEARDAYLACATQFPYPRGAYWDDALFRAAEKELALGAPEKALLHLERMLSEQESAIITGSYERGRYAEAQLKVAEIYRDLLHDPARARRELRRVWEKHGKSRLADDALFQEALLARAAGDQAGTCAPLSIIVQRLPESRYAACAHLLCSTLASTSGECHDYIRRAAGLP
jgi:tetratricopeptide (TPR) repeat protein